MAKAGEIRSLTGLRGVAALVVMAYHYRNLASLAPHGPSALGPGYLMVDLFFILSGFVMARTYGEAFSGADDWRCYVDFLEARVARVYPLYAVLTLVTLVLVVAMGQGYPTRPVQALLTNLLLVQNLGSGLLCSTCSEKLILPGWSISTEAAAYLLFPALASMALFGSRAAAIRLLAGSAAAIGVVSALPFSWLHAIERHGPLDVSGGETLWPLLRCLAGFCIGLIVWRVHTSGVLAFIGRRHVSAVLAVAFGALWFVRGSDLLIVALFPVLILHLCASQAPLAQALGSVWPYRAGEWSYAIYLLHWPALTVMPLVLPRLKAVHLPHAWSVCLALIAMWTIAMSALAHHAIERPARRELRAVFGRRRLAIALEPSAP